jgi:hypothetical protein
VNDTPALTLDLHPWDREFLRDFFGETAEDLRNDLTTGRVRNPASTEEAIRAYDALASGAEAGTIEADDEVRRRASLAARAADRENEWDRIAREHLAFGALVDQLLPPGALA